MLLFREQSLNPPDDLCDALFLIENTGCELLGRKMRDVFLCARFFAVEVAASGEQLGGRNTVGLRGPVAPAVVMNQ